MNEKKPSQVHLWLGLLLLVILGVKLLVGQEIRPLEAFIGGWLSAACLMFWTINWLHWEQIRCRERIRSMRDDDPVGR